LYPKYYFGILPEPVKPEPTGDEVTACLNEMKHELVVYDTTKHNDIYSKTTPGIVKSNMMSKEIEESTRAVAYCRLVSNKYLCYIDSMVKLLLVSNKYLCYIDSLITSIPEGSKLLPSLPVKHDAKHVTPKNESSLSDNQVQAVVKLVNESATANALSVRIAASWEQRGERLTVCETEFVTKLSNLVRLEQIEGASIRIVVNSDTKDSCDMAEIFELEALMKSLLEKLNVVEMSNENQVINVYREDDSV